MNNPGYWQLQENKGRAFGLLTARFVAGGALLFASFGKLGDPSKLMLSMKSFDLVPVSMIPFLSYALPWTELVAGLLLVYGIWTRASGFVALGLYTTFTLALASVLYRDLPVDCGCFGGLFGGGSTVGWHSIARNSVFIVASLATVVWGGGLTAFDRFLDADIPEERLDLLRPPGNHSNSNTPSESRS